MLDLDLENLPRAVRAMKCQALAAELAAIRAKLATAQTDEDRQRCRQASALLEEDIAAAAGTAEERAREAAETVIEGSVADHLRRLLLLRLSPHNSREQQEVEGGLSVELRRLANLNPARSPYTSDAEEKLKQIRELVESDSGNSDWLRLTFTRIREIVGAP